MARGSIKLQSVERSAPSRSRVLSGGSTGKRTQKAAKPDAAASYALDPVVANILNAAGEVLDEHGYEGFNTTAVALQAGISTSTLYRHYPDKNAILLALVTHVQAKRRKMIRQAIEPLAGPNDWRATVDDIIRTSHQLRDSQTGGRSVQQALQMSPELSRLAFQNDESMSRIIAEAMRQRKPSLTPALANRIALVATMSASALLNVAGMTERNSKAIVDEAVLMVNSYLAHYLD